MYMEIWQSPDGSEIAVTAATWEMNPKITFESLAAEFQRNPVKAWRNYGSVVTLNIEAAIKDTDAVLRHANTLREDPWDAVRNRFKVWFRGRPGVRYFLHFDLSKNRDATGIGLSHRERTGVSVVDFMHRVESVMGQDINYGKLREDYIYELTNRGFHLQLITYDGFQSVETQQVLKEKGYETDQCSADKTTEPYDTLIEQVLGQRIDYYVHPTFIRELEELKLVNGTKYDHPRKTRTGAPGSKDVTDAVACSVFRALNYELENPLPAAGRMVVISGVRSGWIPRFGDERNPY